MMSIRKISLLSAIAVLTCIWILQLVFSASSSITSYQLSDKPDAITITRADNSVLHLSKDGEKWLLGDQKYPADMNMINAMLGKLDPIKVLGRVGSGDYERYGLQESGRLSVVAVKNGKTIRSLIVGKNAVSAQQSYILLDDDKNVILVAGSYRDSFDKTIDDLRDKAVWSLSPDSITSVTWTNPAAGKVGAAKLQWELSKTGTPPVWSLVSGKTGPAIDTQKTTSWITGLANLRVQAFAPPEMTTPNETITSLKLSVPGKDYALTVFNKTGDNRYLCSSPEVMGLFYLDGYNGQNILKTIQDLAK